MVTLKFEDFEVNNQKIVLNYANKKSQRKRITIAHDLYGQIIDFKNFKIEKGRYHEKVYLLQLENIDRTFCIWFNKIKTSKEILKKV